MKIVILIIAIVIPRLALSCKCMPMSFDEEVRRSDRIFHGRIIAVNANVFVVEVIAHWKGDFNSRTLQLVQGLTSCSKRLFEMDREYLFFTQGESVYNCSRTDEFDLTADTELLELKFKSTGSRDSIESTDHLTHRQREVLKSMLTRTGNDDSGDLGTKKILFAIEEQWVSKRSFFESYRWSSREIQFPEIGFEGNPNMLVIWIGHNWVKSGRKLKRDFKHRKGFT